MLQYKKNFKSSYPDLMLPGFAAGMTELIPLASPFATIEANDMVDHSFVRKGDIALIKKSD